MVIYSSLHLFLKDLNKVGKNKSSDIRGGQFVNIQSTALELTLPLEANEDLNE